MQQVHDYEVIITWVCIVFISVWGGLVRYLINIQHRHQQWKSVEMFVQIIISTFSGFIGGLLSFEYGNSHYLPFILCGICSVMGNKIFYYLWKRYFIS